MFFAKDEIIELEDNEKYLILDTAIIDNKSYYKIKQVNETLDKLIGDYKIISASSEGGVLSIDDDLNEEEKQKLSELFES